MKPLGGKAVESKPSESGGQPTRKAVSRFEPLPLAMKRAGRAHAKKAGGQTGHAGHEKKVETEEENGVITKIIVTCSCGEVTEIECGYGGREEGEAADG